MPNTFIDLPPDHPIFSTGPSFVFKSPPEPVEEEVAPEADEQGEGE